MRIPIRNTVDLCLAAVTAVLGIALDASLLSIAKAHSCRLFAAASYRPVYTRSGRRNRITF